MQRRNLFGQFSGFWAGILLGLAIVTPVFAATGTDTLAIPHALIVGLGALLLIALALQILVITHRAVGRPTFS